MTRESFDIKLGRSPLPYLPNPQGFKYMHCMCMAKGCHVYCSGPWVKYDLLELAKANKLGHPYKICIHCKFDRF